MTLKLPEEICFIPKGGAELYHTLQTWKYHINDQNETIRLLKAETVTLRHLIHTLQLTTSQITNDLKNNQKGSAKSVR